MKRMRFYKHLLVLSTILFIFLGSFVGLSFRCHAEGDDYSPDVVTEYRYYINPNYKGLVTEADLIHEEEIDALAGKSKSKGKSKGKVKLDGAICHSVGDVAVELRNRMKQRTSNVTISFSFEGTNYDANKLINLQYDAMNQAFTHTGNGSEGDYLSWAYCGYGMQISYGRENGYTNGTFKYVITYYTNSSQEAAVTKKAQQITSSLGLSSKSEYEKVYAVYKYICDNVKYDRNSSNIKYSCYAAMVNNSAVCQGYALMAYRLLNDAGVSCRFVAGDTTSGAHGWNIVRIGSLYYNFDATWDAGKSDTNYLYFLKSDANFPNHKRWAKYKTNEFNATYPMSSTDYDTGIGVNSKITGIKVSKEKLVINAGKTAKLSATTKPGGSNAKNVKWTSSNTNVAKVNGSGKVSAIAKGTCIITVSSANGNYSSKCYVTVKPGKKVAVKSVKLSKKKLTLAVGDKYTFTAKIKPTKATNQKVSYKSSNKKVAKVNKKGELVALKPGRCIITVTTKDGKKTAKCKVKVK